MAAVLRLHREPAPRARGTWNLRASIRSTSASAKTTVRRLLSSRSKSCPSPATDVASTTAPVESTQALDIPTTKRSLAPAPTYSSVATTIRPAVPALLGPKKSNTGDSGVALPAEYSPNAHDNAELLVPARVKRPRSKSRRPRPKRTPSCPPARVKTKNTAVVAVRSVDRPKGPARPEAQLASTVLQLFLLSAFRSMTTKLHALHRGYGDESYSVEGLLYCSEIVAALRISLRQLGVDEVPGGCDKTFDVCKPGTGVPPSRCAMFSAFLGPVDLLFGDNTFPLAAHSETCLPITANPNQEYSPNQSRCSGSNGQKRSRANQSPAGEETKRQCLDRGAGGRNNAGDGDGNDDNERWTEPLPTEYVGGEGSLFACPFFKHDPIYFRDCLFRHTSTRTNYLKQHLRRHHLQPIHCPICGQKFKSLGEKDDHIRLQTCPHQQFHHAGLTNEQMDRLGTIPRNKSPAERWYMMWEIIYGPDVPRPESPYVRDPWVEVVAISSSMFAKKGRLGQMEREGIVLSRRGHVVGGQGGASSPGEAWEHISKDMVSLAETLVHAGPKLADPAVSQAVGQQPDNAVVPNSEPPSQDGVGAPSMIVPSRRFRTSSNASHQQFRAADSGLGFSSSQSSASGHRWPYGTWTQEQQSVPPPAYPVQEEWRAGIPTMPAYQPFTPEMPRMFGPDEFDPGSMVSPVFSQSSGQAPAMDRSSLSHNSLPPETLRGPGTGMEGGGMRASFQGFPANSPGQVNQGGGLGQSAHASFGASGTPSGLSDTQSLPVFSKGMQGGTQGTAHSQNFVNGLGNSGAAEDAQNQDDWDLGPGETGDGQADGQEQAQVSNASLFSYFTWDAPV